MSRILALGDGARIKGYALAGVEVMPVEGQAEIEAAWSALPADTGVLIMTPEVARVVSDRLWRQPRLLWAVLPE